MTAAYAVYIAVTLVRRLAVAIHHRLSPKREGAATWEVERRHL